MKSFIELFFDLRGEVGGTTAVTKIDGLESMDVKNNVVYYTKAINISKAIYFGLHLQASSAGTPALQIDMQQSFQAPTNDGAADSNFVIPDGASALYTNLADTLAHVKQISPVPMTWIRFKISGLGSNPADTTLKMKLFTQGIN